MSEDCITNADDRQLVSLIDRATTRLLFVGPGVSKVVANALVGAWKRLGPRQVQVILDPDPEVMRLGYGSIEGLQILSDTERFLRGGLRAQPGIRIGLLVSDEVALVYSPTPLLIEGEAASPTRPNAVLLDRIPPSLAADTGLTDGGGSKLGLDPLAHQTLEAVKRDLEAAPPVKFNLARQVRVFTSRFQFVELEMTGCFVSRKKVAIPSSLIGLTRDPAVEQQFHAHFDLVHRDRLSVSSGNRTITERSLLDRRRAIEKRFLIQLKGFGSVVLRGNKRDLERAVDELSSEVKAFSEGVKEALEYQMEGTQGQLVEALFPAVKNSPPPEFIKFHGPGVSDEYLRKRLAEEIARAFGPAEALVDAMSVRLVFKDVAYESLVDEVFLRVARAAMPDIDFLHKEWEGVVALQSEDAT